VAEERRESDEAAVPIAQRHRPITRADRSDGKGGVAKELRVELLEASGLTIPDGEAKNGRLGLSDTHLKMLLPRVTTAVFGCYWL
jgi:hypothetical protein